MGDDSRRRPLTIAHVLSSFGIGGQERVALDLARVQKRLGHDLLVVSLAAPPHGPLAEDFRAAGVRVVAAPKGKGIDVGLIPRLAATFLLERVDVVHTHNPLPLVYAAPAAKLARARVVHSKHGINPYGERALKLRRQIARLTDAFVAVSQLTAEVARDRRECAPEKLRVVDNGIDLSRFTPDPAIRAAVRAELGFAEDDVVFGTVGRLMPEKDQGLFIRAGAPLTRGRARLVLVGGGPDEAALRAIAGDNPRITFTGLRRDVPRLLAGFDAFVLSSKLEGLPLVIPEAMAMQLPVVATAVGGVPGVVSEGETGFLVPAGDEVQLRDRLERLLGEEELRRQLGARARTIALERYSAERMTEDYLAVYREVLEPRRARA